MIYSRSFPILLARALNVNLNQGLDTVQINFIINLERESNQI